MSNHGCPHPLWKGSNFCRHIGNVCREILRGRASEQEEVRAGAELVADQDELIHSREVLVLLPAVDDRLPGILPVRAKPLPKALLGKALAFPRLSQTRSKAHV
jgi:hypothetical protein